MSGASGLEIERTFLLQRMPVWPTSPVEPERLEIEQGYLVGDGTIEGRIRRVRSADGGERYFHTIKRGVGLVRQESEREIGKSEFDRHWPSTVGRRLRKTRHRIAVEDLVWEIDCFHDLPPIEGRNLVMAEIEIPEGRDPHSITVPAWIASEIVREVTEEPRFRNFALATASDTIPSPWPKDSAAPS